MANSKGIIEELAIPIAIPRQAIAIAERFAAEVSTARQAQVRLNTIAVLATRNYLRMQGYETKLENSYIWNPMIRKVDDVADLVIEGLGRLECRALVPGQEACEIPIEVQDDRIGYMAVELDLEEQRAILLGFVPTLDPDEPLEEIQRDELYSMDDFIDHLYRLTRMIEENHPAEIVAQLERLFLAGSSPAMMEVEGLGYLRDSELLVRIPRGSGVRGQDDATLTDATEQLDYVRNLVQRLREIDAEG